MQGRRTPPGRAGRRYSIIFRWGPVGAAMGEGMVGTLGLTLLSLPRRGYDSTSFSLGLEGEEKRGRALARCPVSLALATLTPHNPPQLWRLLVSKLGRRIPQLRPAPFYLQASGPGPVPPSHGLSILESPPPPQLYPDPPSTPGSQDPNPFLPPTPTTRPGSHLGGSAAAAQKAALLQLRSGCCSRLLLLFPSSPRCPPPDPGRCHRRCSSDAQVHGCQPQLLAPTHLL